MLFFFLLLFTLTTWAATPALRLQSLINPPSNAPGDQTWLGGDVASSIEWNRHRYIWLFGDTILGKSRFPVRIPVSFIHNSIGIMRYDTSKHRWQSIKKYHDNKTNQPQAIFKLPDPGLYFWPLTGIRIHNKLLILGTYSKTKQKLNIQGSAWVLVDNPQKKPTQWRYHIKKLSDTDTSLTWSSAIVAGTKHHWLYIFGNLRKNKMHEMALARITLVDALHGRWRNRQYWTHRGWQYSAHTLRTITGLPVASEMSVFHNKKWGWYTVQVPTLTAHCINLYSSAHLTGPWHLRSRTPLHLPWPDSNDHYFFYAAKLHPQLSKNKFIVTYNINTFNNLLFERQFPKPSHKALYIPQFIVLIPPNMDPSEISQQ